MHETRHRLLGVLAGVTLLAAVGASAHGVTARWAYEDAYDNVNGGDWYRDSNNETATLAWGESYAMMSLAAMFRATGDPVYLDRLGYHIDGVLAQRDDARGVTDYRGVSGACWRNTHYQPADQPYCYVVHTGMIAYPMAEYARLVSDWGLEAEEAPDGETFGQKATRFVTAAEECMATHDDQWHSSGYYFFRSDATFLTYAGTDLPLNQSNAMGRLLLVLHDVTGVQAYHDKAAALAARFRAQITTGGDGALLWNYWGGTYSSPGEDVSHAAINVSFAAMAAERSISFNAADLEGLATTFVERVYVDDQSFHDNVGGGGINGSSYRPQLGRWLMLTPIRTQIYTAVRGMYDQDYPPDTIGSGSLLQGWGLLAEFEPVLCPHFFYSVDWDDQGDHREATAYGANILTSPPDLTEGCMIPLEVDVPRQTTVGQWDGANYHPVTIWQPTSGFVSRFLPYEHLWPYLYWQNGVLFQFADSFVAGDGILVKEPPSPELPVITSSPPTSVVVGQAYTYPAAGTGDPPLWWGLAVFPTGARVDAASGLTTWIPPQIGPADFTLTLENDWGRAEQVFTVQVVDPAGSDAGVDAGFDGGTGGDAGGGDAAPGRDAGQPDDGSAETDAGPTGGSSSGCSCQTTSREGLILGLLLCLGLWLRRRPGEGSHD